MEYSQLYLNRLEEQRSGLELSQSSGKWGQQNGYSLKCTSPKMDTSVVNSCCWHAECDAQGGKNQQIQWLQTSWLFGNATGLFVQSALK